MQAGESGESPVELLAESRPESYSCRLKDHVASNRSTRPKLATTPTLWSTVIVWSRMVNSMAAVARQRRNAASTMMVREQRFVRSRRMRPRSPMAGASGVAAGTNAEARRRAPRLSRGVAARACYGLNPLRPRNTARSPSSASISMSLVVASSRPPSRMCPVLSPTA